MWQSKDTQWMQSEWTETGEKFKKQINQISKEI